MKSDLLLAVTQLAAERSLPPRIVVSAIQDALAAAYKRDNAAQGQEVEVIIDTVTGDVSVYTAMEVVMDDDIEDEKSQISLLLARKTDPDIEVGRLFRTGRLEYQQARITAQATRQMVLQRLRNAQREVMFEEYADTTGTVVNARILRIENKVVKVELDKGTAIMPPLEQAEFERKRYYVGQQLKVYIVKASKGPMGPEIIVSRSHHGLLLHLFNMEVPEINSGVVEIKAVGREAGSRSKVAVASSEGGVDPVGACVGLRGIRIQSICNELLGEKIDVVEWSEDPREFIANALSPASVISVELDEEKSVAKVTAVERQLPLVIGREGQNARLASKLTNWAIEVVCEEQSIPQPEPKDPAEKPQVVKAKAEVDEAKQATAFAEKKTQVEHGEPDVLLADDEKERSDSKEGDKGEHIWQPDSLETVENGHIQKKPEESTSKDTMTTLQKELEDLERKAIQRAKPKKEGIADVLDISSDEIWQMDRANQSKNEENTLRFAEDIEGFRQAGDRSAKPQRRKTNVNRKSRH